MTDEPAITFDQLALSQPVLKAVIDVGYETPSPIQAKTIPLLLEGGDMVGQAQTGTGKTAAFALPILTNLDLAQKDPQVMVLVPTRELAIQVAEAFQKYASNLKGFHVLPIYGGQEYGGQLRALKRGVHVVVGTPGRVMDHMRKRSLKLNKLSTLVLDEADEMLRMGFIDDVEWILEQTPSSRQIALFSATMPQQIRRIANRYLNDPKEITIKVKTATADLIHQRFWPVSGMHKLDALTRILEAEQFDGMIIFVRTRITTIELADKLSARGFSATALNGDIPQAQRERTIGQLKKGKLDILVATDVAARGLDVERISHVVNYDIPHDTEAYIHRIGRTGRAGRKGSAILFVAPREKRFLHAVERATGKKIEQMDLPSTAFINDRRIEQFKQGITDTLAAGELTLYAQMVEQYQQEHNIPALEMASALAKMVQGDTPLLLQHKARPKKDASWDNSSRDDRKRTEGKPRMRQERERNARQDSPPAKGMERFRIEVGHNHKVMPGNIVGAIANEADIESKHIGRINIYAEYSTVDLPGDMPDEIFGDLKKTWVAGQALNISRFSEDGKSSRTERPKKNKTEGQRKKKPKNKIKDKPKAKSEHRSKTKNKTGTKNRARDKPSTTRKAKESAKA